ncbi:amidase family protein [Chaetomium tenue]|uniref:Amidase family protein n=1 Tax=Chaetomium tenue TaxID=1854479 RepID=A0ACB7PI55_9PEZI|nr:amidase family protein [Chaetomium globosum]
MASRRYWLFFSLTLALAAILPWLGSDPHTPKSIPASFDLLTLTAHDITKLLGNQTFTSLQLTQAYLRRIEFDDRSGLGLHTMLELTPVDITLGIARERDLERRKGLLRSPLHGVPLIIKGNMATGNFLGMKTTSGAYALQNATASNDAFIVEKAREAGMIVIGKANLGELNGFKDNNLSPGWSQLGGETLSPYDLQHPCGSSAGPAAAVAAGFAPFAFGTETQGSISCPASFTALYGLKVSTGLLSRSGILPSSTTFDSPGILAKSAWDIAALLTQTVGNDPEDPITADSIPFIKNFTASLDSNWKDFKIGVADRDWFWSILPGFVGDQADIDDEERMFSLGLEAVAEMGKRGATIVPDAKIRSAPLSTGHVPKLMGKIIRHKMGPGFAKHVASLEDAGVQSLEQLVDFNRKHPELSYAEENAAQGYLESALHQHLSEEEYRAALSEARIIAIDEGIIEALDKYNLDVLVLPAWTEMSIYAAWAQAPTATVPLGTYRHGKPYGLGFVARRFDDDKLLQIMKLYEETFGPRLVPSRMRWKRWKRVVPQKYLEALAFGRSHSF